MLLLVSSLTRPMTIGLTLHGGYASFWHFFIKLFFAAPANGLPSLPTAFGSQASFLHLLTAEVLAAPESGLPSLLTAWVSQALCARADPVKDGAIMIAIRVRDMFSVAPNISGRSWPRPRTIREGGQAIRD